MEMNKRPLWSGGQDVDTILGYVEDGEYSIDGLVDIIFNLFEDIQCLKEDLEESNTPNTEYSYSFGKVTLYYDTAYEFGYKVGKLDCLEQMGYNPYEPNTKERDVFIRGYLKGKL